jgi:FLVCR family feline leukemia virus subgroup C receptor-related protein
MVRSCVVAACLFGSAAGLAVAPAFRPALAVRGATLLPCKTVACKRRRLAVAPIASGAKESGGNWVLDPHRWVQLVLISLLALLSDWTCFATVAVPSAWMTLEVRRLGYNVASRPTCRVVAVRDARPLFCQGHDAAELIDLFLLANVVSCFFFSDVASIVGLRKVRWAPEAASERAPPCVPCTAAGLDSGRERGDGRGGGL